MKLVLSFILTIFFFICSFAQSNTDIGFVVENSLIIKLKDEYRPFCSNNSIRIDALSTIFSTLNVTELNKVFPKHLKPNSKTDRYGNVLVDLSLIYRLNFDSDVSSKVVQFILLNSGYFEYVEQEVYPELLFVPNDPGIVNQYYLTKIKAYQAWDLWQGDSNFVVGITDTGYDLTHPDLVDALKYNWNDPLDGIDNDNDGFIDNFYGWNVGSNNNNVQYNAHAHGVHVSGLAGATVNNTFGIAGVGFKTKLLPVKIDNNQGIITRPYEGIVYAADHGAKVINCSWGSNLTTGQFGQDVINYATFNKQTLVVAAAGNSNNEVKFYPCSYDNVLCVAGSNINDLKWEGSSYYTRVDISAPGDNIYSTWVNGGFTYSGGTSMASPIVAGAAALVWSKYPNLMPLQIKELLRNTADYIDTIGTNNIYAGKLGKGRLNMYRAVSESFVPAVRLVDIDIYDNNDDVFVVNDTLNIVTHFRNFLAPTANLNISLSTNSSYVQVLNSSYNAGQVAEMQLVDNSLNPFKIILLPGMPSNYKLEIKFLISDGSYNSYDLFSMFVNIDYKDISVNKIRSTITSRGLFGYNDIESFTQGNGLLFENSSASIISSSGLMIGNSNNKVMDNLYNVTSNVDNDFKAINSVININPPTKGAQYLATTFDDSGASNRIGVMVNQNTYAYNYSNHQNYFIVEYDIINVSQTNLSSLYVGIFTDWELKIRSNNKGSTSFVNQMGYVHTNDSSLFAGVQLLKPQSFLHYAIDNDGQNNSVKLTDGFSTVEKFTTLSNSRLTSGAQVNGNNVSQVVSSGPHSLSINDTLKLAFAFHTANSLNEILNSAGIAAYCYENDCFASVEKFNNHLSVFPNPASDFIFLNFEKLGDYEIRIFDVNGKLVKKFEIKNSNSKEINISELNSGIYFIELKSDIVQVSKFIKY